MRRIHRFERSLDQWIGSRLTGHVCRSCQLRLISTQQRQPQSSRPQIAERPRFGNIKSRGAATEASILEDGSQLAADPKSDPNYVEAFSGNGLERVGSKRWIEEQLDEGDTFIGFPRKKQLKLSEETVTRLLLKAASSQTNPSREAATRLQLLRETSGKAPSEPSPQVTKSQGYARAGFSADDVVVADETEEPSPEITAKEMEQSMATAEIEEEAEQEAFTTQSEEPLMNDGDLFMSIADPGLKLRITKYMIRETGVRLPDVVLYNAKTLHDLRAAYLKKPEPKKLAQSLSMAEQLQALANVKIAPRRVTPIDKEKAVGRWKLIEEELVERGLPVTGHTTRVKKQTVESYESGSAKHF